MEEWARSQNGNLLVEFSSRDGEIESILKDISERAQGKGNFSYSRFFAVGLFRLLELSNATEPTVLDKVILAIIYSVRTFPASCYFFLPNCFSFSNYCLFPNFYFERNCFFRLFYFVKTIFF